MKDKYIIIVWPDSQLLMEMENYESHSYLINDEKGLDEYGSLSFFVEESWYNRQLTLSKKKKRDSKD